MARQEEDREDLMREATALFPRAEFILSQETMPLFWGQKRSGHFSFYFGSDPVYQFDQAGHLRRAYLDGLLYRTQGTTLARLERVRTQDTSSLQRYDLSQDELQQILDTMHERFYRLSESLDDPRRFRLASFLADDSEPDLLNRIRAQVSLVLKESNELSPRLRGKR